MFKKIVLIQKYFLLKLGIWQLSYFGHKTQVLEFVNSNDEDSLELGQLYVQ
jgi:hypothetical protein